ncbi:MAG TPA: site-2 protease family protein [Acidimicrobiales bacterium]|jgi:Zn-dependent protease|nr:site-2 protease family protein [Acidimicrobiales bacterium]
MDQRTKATLWTVAIAVLVVALVVHHNITKQEIIIFCVVVPSIILHEVSHGFVANMFGDDTAKRAGRLSLNPIVHVDPVGTLIVPALLALSGIGVFGWAKPVPVNVGRLRSPRNEGVVVSLVGPFVNVVLAAVFALLFIHFARPNLPEFWRTSADWSTSAQILYYAGVVNVGLFVFNMIPVPPLDGSVLFERMLPRSWWPTYLRYRQYTMPILLGLVVLNFFLDNNGHTGPITWLFNEIYSWWAGVLGVQ